MPKGVELTHEGIISVVGGLEKVLQMDPNVNIEFKKET